MEEGTLNPKLLAAEYAVRGAIAQKAEEYSRQLKEGKQLPCKKIISCNIGATCDGPCRGGGHCCPRAQAALLVCRRSDSDPLGTDSQGRGSLGWLLA